MNVTLAPAQIAALFPASIRIDSDLRVTWLGPALHNRFCGLVEGSALPDHFRMEPADWANLLPASGEAGQPIRLFAHEAPMQLGGSILAVDDGFLLAVNLMPSILALENDEFRMADFAPTDPLVPALMLVALQRQMLEDGHRAAEELDRERNRHAELWRRISRVAGHMAHDFANVFSIIVMNARRLSREGRLTTEDRRLARIIEQTVERGSIATHSLMTISQQQHDSPVPASPDRIIRDYLHFFSTIAGPLIELTLDLADGEEACSVSRSGLINGIIDLVVYARDSMPAGGTITISTRICDARDRKDGVVEIRIESCAADLAGKALAWAPAPAPFLHQPQSGPDLLAVEEFARVTGGEFVRISDTPDRIAFAIRLPLLARAVASADSANRNPNGNADRGEHRHVLVVEDEPFALEAITELLTEDGFAVTPAADANAALTALCDTRYDVLLSDVVLPGMSGVELAHKVTDSHPKMKVILMSGYVPDQQAMQSGWHFLRKPLDVTMLRRLLHAH